MTFESKFLEAFLLAVIEGAPIDFGRVNEREVTRARIAIKRAASSEGWSFRAPVTRNDFLCACLDFTEHVRNEHLIVGYGFKHGRTTKISRVHRVPGEERWVRVPGYIQQEIGRHYAHRTDAEVLIFHNHPRTGDEPEWFYALKSLVQDIPIASQGDRYHALQYRFSILGLLRQLCRQGQVRFYVGESGLVKPFGLPPLSPLLQLTKNLRSPPTDIRYASKGYNQ